MVKNIFTEKKCENCGKIIFPTIRWAYKIVVPKKGTKYYCTYTCFKKGKWDNEV